MTEYLYLTRLFIMVLFIYCGFIIFVGIQVSWIDENFFQWIFDFFVLPLSTHKLIENLLNSLIYVDLYPRNL